MKLWLNIPKKRMDYDQYDSCVVAAETEEAARATHPSGGTWGNRFWVDSPDKVTTEYLGEAREGMPAGVVHSSFIEP